MAQARLIPGSNKQTDPNIKVITSRVKQKDSNFLFNVPLLIRKENNDILFHTATLKVHETVTCYH